MKTLFSAPLAIYRAVRTLVRVRAWFKRGLAEYERKRKFEA